MFLKRAQKQANDKWKMYKLTNVTLLLREVPMKCKDAILPEPLTKKYSV